MREKIADALKGILFSQGNLDIEIAQYEAILRGSNLLQKISRSSAADSTVQSNMYPYTLGMASTMSIGEIIMSILYEAIANVTRQCLLTHSLDPL